MFTRNRLFGQFSLVHFNCYEASTNRLFTVCKLGCGLYQLDHYIVRAFDVG